MTKSQRASPYTPDELCAIATGLAGEWKVEDRWFEDVVAEGVSAGWEAGGRENRGIRSLQYRRLRGAMLDFLKRENRQDSLAPPGCLPGAKRISLDMPVPGMDGEPTTLAETVRDPNMPMPDAGLREANRVAAVTQAMSRLTPEEADAVRRVHIDGQTQEAAAAAMGLSRREVQGRMASGGSILRIWMSEYSDDFRFANRPKKKKS